MTKRILIIGCLGIAMLLKVQAQLAVTEVMTGEVDKDHPDWFELHNYGTNTLDLTGYSWNDNAHDGFSGADTTPFTGVTIDGGGTIIFTEPATDVNSPADFRTWWGIGTNVQVVMLNAADPGLGKGGDSVRLWSTNLMALGSDTNGLDLDECSDFLVQRVDTGATTIQSLLYDPTNGLYDILSSNGVDGAFASTVGDIGSPGIVPAAVPATITQTPVDQTANIGDSVTFTNAGLGLPPLVFHWYFGTNRITSQTPGVSIYYTNDTSVLTLTSVQTTNAGTYTVIASNGLQSFTNSAVLTVNSQPSAPAVLSYSPALNGGFDAYFGQTIDFNVLVSGYPAPTYQWYKNNALISGETNADLTLSLNNTNQSGTYSVTVDNSAGSTNVSFNVNVTPVPNLVVTEVESDESTNNSNGDTSGHNDWFELSNFGSFPVNLYGFRIDDSHQSLTAAATVTNQTMIHPGESVVFVQDMTPDEFRTWWGTNLSSSVQIIDYDGSGQGLSSSGDWVYVWNAAATDINDFIASAQFSAATNGVSFGFDPTHLDASGFLGFMPDGLSVAGVNGAFVAAVGGDIGSPGAVVNMPRFTKVAPHGGGGFDLSWFCQPDWNYTIQYKTNLTDSSWTTLTSLTSGSTNAMNYTDTTTDTQRFYRVLLNLAN